MHRLRYVDAPDGSFCGERKKRRELPDFLEKFLLRGRCSTHCFFDEQAVSSLWSLEIKDLPAEAELAPKLPISANTFQVGDLGSAKVKRVSMILDPRCRYCAHHISALNFMAQKLKVKIDLRVVWSPADEECNGSNFLNDHKGACQLSKLFLCLPLEKGSSLLLKISERPALAQSGLLKDLISSQGSGVEECILNKEKVLREQIEWSEEHGSMTPITWANNQRFKGALEKEHWFSILTNPDYSDTTIK